MKRISFLYSILLSTIFISCNNGNEQNVPYKEYISPDSSFKVSIPNDLNLDSRSRSNYMVFTGDKKYIYINKFADYSFDEESIKINQPGDPYHFDLIEQTDTTKLYKYSKGLLVLYEFYLLKKLSNGYYLISIKDDISNKSDIIARGLRVYDSLRLNHETPTQGEKAKETSPQKEAGKVSSTADPSMNNYATKKYSFSYPKDWIITENPNSVTDVHIGSNTSNIGLTVVSFVTEQTLESIQEEGDESMRQSGYDVVEFQTLEINNIRAYRRLYFAINKDADILSDDEVDTRIISYSLKKGNQFFNVKFGNCNTDDKQKLAERIIKTFKCL